MDSEIASLECLRSFEKSLADGASGYDFWMDLDNTFATIDLLIDLLNIEFEYRRFDPKEIPGMLLAIEAAGGKSCDVETLLSDLVEQLVHHGVRPTLVMFRHVPQEYCPSLKIETDPCHLGQVVDGRFRVEERVGHGGFGVVYGVQNIQTDERRAMKAPHQTDSENDKQAHSIQLANEWLAMDWLAGRGCPRGCELSRTAQFTFITMDYIDGSSLRDVIRRGSMEVMDALQILFNVAKTVAYAHSQGYIHRDLKPENILIDEEGEVFIVDFGLVATVPHGSEQSDVTAVAGTKGYMVPSTRGKLECEFKARDDLFAIGIILHEMLAGIRPAITRGSKADDTCDYLVRLSLPISLPNRLVRIVQKCVTPHEPDWYADADKLADDIRSFLVE